MEELCQSGEERVKPVPDVAEKSGHWSKRISVSAQRYLGLIGSDGLPDHPNWDPALVKVQAIDQAENLLEELKFDSLTFS